MPEYRIPLDPRNPGQFLACCGLFELSELLAPGGEAQFADGGAAFLLTTQASALPPQLALFPPSDLAGKPYEATLEPLDLAAGDRSLTLNWWLNETLTAKSALKTWGGQQTPRRLLTELTGLLDYSKPLHELFRAAVFTTSRFGVDPRSAWEALDVGYSPNDIGQPAMTFPWVEVLAVIGLQGFRPTFDRERRSHRYSVWGTPLPLVPARAACSAPWPGAPARTFEFSIAVRGQGYKTFLFAEGVNHA